MTEIIENKENFLLNRREVKLVVKADKNPSYDEALLILSKQLKAVPENIVINGIKGKFGRDTFLITAFAYKSQEDREKFEPKAKVKKSAEEVKT